MESFPRRYQRRALTPDEMEAVSGIDRNVPRAVTQNDIKRLTRKHLGRLWGRKRRKLEGWPR